MGDDGDLLGLAHGPCTGDLEGMVKQGFIHVVTANNPLYFGAEDIEQRGLAVDVAQEFGPPPGERQRMAGPDWRASPNLRVDDAAGTA